MPTVDHERQNLVFRVLVIGGASDLFMGALPLKNGELQGQDVQGWHPSFVFEAFPLDPWAGDGAPGARLEQLIPYADALVLTDAYAAGSHYSSSATERLSRTLGPARAKLAAVIFGGPALAEEWRTLSGADPIIAVEPEPQRAKEAMKALARHLLRSRMKSTPPPPG